MFLLYQQTVDILTGAHACGEGSMMELTTKQAQVLAFLQTRMSRPGQAPSCGPTALRGGCRDRPRPGMDRARGRRRGSDRSGGDGQDDPVPTSAAWTQRGQRDRHGDVARTAEADRAAACTARGLRRPPMGVTDSRPAWIRPEGVVAVADARVDPPEASCHGSHAYERRKYCWKP
jgi:hypothetical protein